MKDDEVDARIQASVAYYHAKDYPAALKEINEILRYHPDNFRALYGLANVSRAGHSFGISLLASRRLADLAPNNPSALNCLGQAYDNVGDEDAAMHEFRTSFKIKQDPMTALLIGNIYVNRADTKNALEWFEKARALPGGDDLKRNIDENETYVHLSDKNWARGWELMSLTQGGRNRMIREYGEAIDWDGQPCETLVVYTDQGIGDEIMYASCLPDIRHLAKKIIIDCHERTEVLFAASFPWADVEPTRSNPTPAWVPFKKPTHRVMISELPRYTRNKDEDFTGAPYLVADPLRRMMYRTLLDNVRRINPRRPKIGIAWTGGAPHTGQQRRSLDLKQLQKIMSAIPQADWFSLEHKPAPDAEKYDVHHYSFIMETKDYGDTCAFVAELDAVVTVQTAIVHLSGALGKPAFVMVADRPVWRYGTEGPSMPWYKSVRLYRQVAGDWNAAFDPLIADLKEFISNGTYYRGLSAAAD